MACMISLACWAVFWSSKSSSANSEMRVNLFMGTSSLLPGVVILSLDVPLFGWTKRENVQNCLEWLETLCGEFLWLNLGLMALFSSLESLWKAYRYLRTASFTQRRVNEAREWIKPLRIARNALWEVSFKNWCYAVAVKQAFFDHHIWVKFAKVGAKARYLVCRVRNIS